jgi:aspartate aminotransferase-like enzyme
MWLQKSLAAQAKPMLPHRSKDFEAIFRRTEEKAQKLFYTQYRVFQATSSGSGMQEAGIRNFVQETVLSCVNGAFSQRWYDVAANGKQVDILEVDWGEPITSGYAGDALKKKHYEAVTIVHNETSTGVENPLKTWLQSFMKSARIPHPGGCRILIGWRQNRDGCLGDRFPADLFAESAGAAARAFAGERIGSRHEEG